MVDESVWCVAGPVRMAEAKPGFYKVELINTAWEVPERYQNLLPVGSGAFGQVGFCLLNISVQSFYLKVYLVG